MKNLPTRSEIKCEWAKRSFYKYCQTIAPDFYTDERIHLKELCDKLQQFYERKLLKPDGSYYNKLIIQIPPQHGKSRTLVLFCTWVFGTNEEERIITASYDASLAQDFSRYTRDTIQEEKNSNDQIVYSDIFNAKIKYGDGSYKQWALDGQFFNYKGCGVGSGVTGKGATIRIIDDPVKGAAEAYSELALDSVWQWYTGTWIQRRGTVNMLDIICNTPWAKKDPTGRLLELEPNEWYVISMPVEDKNGNLLCESLLDKKGLKEIKEVADPHIFAANYMMQRLDIKGRLYSGFNTYSELPEKTTNNVSYVDTADEGSDYLCGICGKEKDQYIYITDILYTQEAQETTEPQTADMFLTNDIKDGIIESNNGGRGFARNVQRLIHEKNGRCRVQWFHQSKNKKARILTEAPTVQKYVLFPDDWPKKWPEFYTALMGYQKEGKNKHDDAPDALTGLVEKTVGRTANTMTRRF